MFLAFATRIVKAAFATDSEVLARRIESKFAVLNMQDSALSLSQSNSLIIDALEQYASVIVNAKVDIAVLSDVTLSQTLCPLILATRLRLTTSATKRAFFCKASLAQIDARAYHAFATGNVQAVNAKKENAAALIKTILAQ